MKTCKNKDCGRSNPDNAKFCKSCGIKFANIEIDSDSNTAKIIFTVLGIIAIICLIIYAPGYSKGFGLGIAAGIQQMWK